MAIAFVRNLAAGTDNTSTQTFTITPSANTTAGDSVVMGLYCEDAAPTGITDSKGNTWTKATELFVVTTYGSIQIWSTPQNGGALTTSDTITVDRGTTFNRPTNWCVDEFSGVLTASTPVDLTGSINNTSASQALTATGTTAQADEMAYVYFDGMNATAIALDGNLTATTGADTVSAAGGIGAHRTRAGYAILASAVTNPTYTNTRTGGSKAMAALVTFKAVGGTNGSVTAVPMIAVPVMPAPAVSGTGDATVTAVPMTAAPKLPVPAVSGGANLTTPPMIVTATMPPLNGNSSVEIQVVPIAAVVSLVTPVVASNGNATVTAVPMIAGPLLPAPAVTVNATVSAVVMRTTALLPAPVVSGATLGSGYNAGLPTDVTGNTYSTDVSSSARTTGMSANARRTGVLVSSRVTDVTGTARTTDDTGRVYSTDDSGSVRTTDG